MLSHAPLTLLHPPLSSHVQHLSTPPFTLVSLTPHTGDNVSYYQDYSAYPPTSNARTTHTADTDAFVWDFNWATQSHTEGALYYKENFKYILTFLPTASFVPHLHCPKGY